MAGLAPTWSDEQIEVLKAMWTAGDSASIIGKAIGKTRNSVLGKAHRMNLENRDGANMKRTQTVRAVRLPTIRIPTPVVVLEPPLVVDGALLVVETMPNTGACRWPIGDPRDPDFHFCGNAPHATHPYCAAHARLAYQPKTPYIKPVDHMGKKLA